MKLLSSSLSRLAFVLVVPALLSVTSWAQSKAEAEAQDQADVKALDKLSQKDIAACMSNDAETLCSLWTDDGVLVLPGAAPLVGKKTICEMLQKQMVRTVGRETTGYTEDWEEVRVIGDYAWQWGKMSQTDTDASGKQRTMLVNAIRILHREPDGSWKVARAVVTPAPQ
jgi:uncharacterized protein (TIGR02246 family)